MSFLEIQRAEIGRDYECSVLPPITAEELIEYARTLGIEDPLWLDPEAARAGPLGRLVGLPTFVVKLRGSFYVPPLAASEMSRSGFVGFDGGKDIEFGVPIEPGDSITVRSRITEIYEKTGRSGSMVFLVYRQELRNQRDELIANVDSRMLQKIPPLPTPTVDGDT